MCDILKKIYGGGLMGKGKLFVIEGVDGSGKATQTNTLFQRLCDEKYNVMKIDYPRYNNESSLFVRKYLNGDFGDKAKDISPYIASTFYALDRYASYKEEYENFYNNDGIVIADRYATANMVHQAGKIDDKEDREKFLEWLWNLEFNTYKIPVPDLVFFLDIPIEYNEKLMEGRQNKDSSRKEKDIHESDTEHLLDSYKNAVSLVDKYNWIRINCIYNGNLRSIEDIHSEIYNIVKSKL